MNAYWRFLKSMFWHKWYVLVAGRRLQVPLWRLLAHDLTKFTCPEFGPYARHFYGKEIDPRDFTAAWHFHKLRNDHHWEYWVSVDGNEKLLLYKGSDGFPVMVHAKESLPPDSVLLPVPPDALSLTIPRVTVLPMPMVCVREMVADWFAAGKAYNEAWPNPTNYSWYKQHRFKMHLHPDTETSINLVLTEAAKWRWQ